MEFFPMWWFLAGLVGVVAQARRRRPLVWLLLGIALTPIPALVALFSVPEGALAESCPWSRRATVAVAGLVGLVSLIFYARLAYGLWFVPRSV